MASTQKWRSYGGIGHFESNNNVSFNNLTVGNLSIKNEYIGNFGIHGSLFVNDYATVHGNIRIYGNSEIYGQSIVRGVSRFWDDLTVDGNLVINKSVTINGQLNIGYGFNFDNDINVNGNIGMAGKYIFIGGLSPTYNYGKLICNTTVNEKFIGINQPIETEKVLPGSMLEIYCDSSNNNGITAFNAYSNSLKPAQSVIISNLNYQGTIFYTDISKCSMYMFNENTIPVTTTIDSITGFKYVQPKIINAPGTNANPDLEITYKKGGDLSFHVKNNTFLTSKTIIGKSDVKDVSSKLEEKTIIYNDVSNAKPFNYTYYEISDEYYVTNNGLTLIDETDFNQSNVGLNLVAKDSLTGMKICGGSYILDSTKSMGSIQLSDDGSGNSIPVQTMITSDTPAYRRTSTGINTYAPNTDYTLNINGKTQITDGEIVKIQDVSFQLNGLVGCARNPDYVIGYGSPNVTVVTDPCSNKHPFIYTSDGGISWLVGDFSGNISSAMNQNTLSSNYVFSYNSTYSFTAYEGNNNLFYTSDGANTWHYFDTDISNVTTTTTIRVMDMSHSVMMVCTNVRADNNLNNLCYGTMPDISYILLHSPDIGNSTSINTVSFTIPNGTVTGMDSYDYNYIFITGSFGIYKYQIDSVNETINPVGVELKSTPYNSLYTYKTYTNGKLNPDPNFTVFVGDGYITTTHDCGNTLTVNDVSGNMKSVYIYDSYYAIAIGTLIDGNDIIGVIYVTFDGGENWEDISTTSILNTSGVSNLLLGNGQNLTSVCIPQSSETFLINRVDTEFIPPSQLGYSKLFYCHFPNLYNLDTYTVLDICGSVLVDGYMNINYNANISGSIYVLDGNVLIDQEGGDSYDISSGVLVIPNNCGAAISGNVTIGGNLVCENIVSSNILNLSSLDGNINIGSSSYIYPNKYQTITIGNEISTEKTDNITICGNTLIFDVSYITSFGYNLINLIGQYVTNISLGYTEGSTNGPGLLFYDTSNNYIDPCHNIIVGGFTVTGDGNAFNFWPPYNNKIRLDVGEFALDTSVNKSIVTLSKSTYSDSSYVICNQSDIDISQLVLTTNTNAINNIQTIQTDISVNGNLFVSGGFTVTDSNDIGVIKILDSPMESYSTDSGSLQINGGIGINGNIFTSGSVYISNDTDQAFTVNGSSEIYGNSYIGGNLTVDGVNAYFGDKVYINNNSNPICLSMTDFSSNVIFHSTTESTTTGNGSVVVSGGLGILGNVNIGKNVYMNGKLYANGDCSFNGNVYIPSGTIYFGPSNTHLSMTDFSSNVIFHSTSDSTSTDTGSVVIKGGLGIAKNAYFGNSLFFGPSLTHLSMTDFSSNVIFHSTTDAISTESGSIVVSGGMGIAKNAYFGNSIYFGPSLTRLSMTDFSSNVTFHSTNECTSTDTGSIIVSGGAGIAGNLYLGSGITVDGSFSYFANNVYINSKNGLGPTCLSMTDFSSNVIFHSNVESTSTGSGSVIIGGGLGIAGNTYVGNSIYFGPTSTCLSMTDFSSNVTFHSTSECSSTDTGSIIVSGGAGIAGNLYLGSGITVDGSFAYFADKLYINSKNGLGPTCLSMTDFSSNAVFYSTYDSTSTSTGSVTVRGGVGISRNLYVGSGITVDGNYAYFANKVYINAKNGLGPTSLSMTDFSSNATFYSTSESTSTGTGAIVVRGGLGIASNLYVGKNTRILGTTDSINTSTGTLVVSGGLGIAGNLYAKGYNGGTLSSSSTINFGRTVCYSLQSMTSINISGGLNIYGNVPGTNGIGSLYLNGTSGIYSGGSIYCGDTTPSTALYTGAFQVTGGASVGGNLYVGDTITAPVINQTSDYRIKNNIVELNDEFTVDNLHPIKYYNKLTNRNDIGFLAHEVQEIYPFLVEGIKDGTNYQSLNYTGIIGILVKEIKELKQRVFELENTISI